MILLGHLQLMRVCFFCRFFVLWPSSRQSSWWGRRRVWSSPATGRQRLQQRRLSAHMMATVDLSMLCRGTPSSPKTSLLWETGAPASGLRTSKSHRSLTPSRIQTHNVLVKDIQNSQGLSFLQNLDIGFCKTDTKKAFAIIQVSA